MGSPSFLPSPPNLLLQDQPICYFRDPQLAGLVSELSVCPRLIPGQTRLPLLLHQLWFSQSDNNISLCNLHYYVSSYSSLLALTFMLSNTTCKEQAKAKSILPYLGKLWK